MLPFPKLNPILPIDLQSVAGVAAGGAISLVPGTKLCVPERLVVESDHAHRIDGQMIIAAGAAGVKFLAVALRVVQFAILPDVKAAAGGSGQQLATLRALQTPPMEPAARGTSGIVMWPDPFAALCAVVEAARGLGSCRGALCLGPQWGWCPLGEIPAATG
mmetsp:Transcript_20267/g.61062  ORF Transcript_20267/g.61062 Transcript_20267/m.61062 type:complete len:161 (+) Transcript_20267:1010-1492(+)